ncbi:MAG: alkaline phosphatase family protein [Aurantibacter sp.]
MNKYIVCLLFFFTFFSYSQKSAEFEEDLKVVLITLDGLRWQELFSGADQMLVANKKFVNDTTALKLNFWRENAQERREALMPFFWKQVSTMGQLHGNRQLGSKVNLTNTMWFSYPGYNEILSGNADDSRINSNDKIDNPNKTVLELVNDSPKYKGKVAAFGSWDVFPFIINEKRSGIPVNAGFEKAKGENLSPNEIFLNKLQGQTPSPWSTVRLDVFTHNFALEHLKKEHPRLIYISYGETDDFAHEGHYDAYLNAAKNTDGLIKELWEFCQNDSFYKDKTTFLITTDHGRGTEPLETWKNHGDEVPDAGEVWFVAFGKGVKAIGEVDDEEQLYSNQLAPTILELLGLQVDQSKMPGKVMKLGSE